MDSCVKADRICRWKKEILKAEGHTLACFDLRPYAGQPGHHIFIYEVGEKLAGLLSCSIVWNPPLGADWFQWRYEKGSDTLSVLGVTTSPPFLSINLATLHCFEPY